MKKLTSIMGNSQMLDGGAMFGNVPKALWSKWITPNDMNQIKLCCRALLIQDDEKNILLEAGIGAFFSPELKKRYGINEDKHILLESLKKVAIEPEDIDFVILSHLHFDHAGGLLTTWNPTKEPELVFKNACYVVGKVALDRALNPHPRDKASFIPQLNELLIKSDKLIVVEKNLCPELGNDYHFMVTDGHTPGMLHTVIDMPTGPVIFVADLIPGTPWIHLPVTMGYDRFPELLINEKKNMLEFAIKSNGRVFYTHDPIHAISRVRIDKKGKFYPYDEIESFVGIQ